MKGTNHYPACQAYQDPKCCICALVRNHPEVEWKPLGKVEDIKAPKGKTIIHINCDGTGDCPYPLAHEPKQEGWREVLDRYKDVWTPADYRRFIYSLVELKDKEIADWKRKARIQSQLVDYWMDRHEEAIERLQKEHE